MKILKGLLAVSALAFAGLATTSANAAAICTGCDYAGAATYLGSHDPTQGDGSSFTHTELEGYFRDVWLFEIDPAGDAAINAVFIPTTSISGFTVELWSATPTCALGAPGSLCATGSLDSSVVVGTTAPNFLVNIPFTTLTSGFYAFVIEGTAAIGTVADEFYSGNLTTQVTPAPEPGTLALLGLGLMGLGLSRRRRG